MLSCKIPGWFHRDSACRPDYRQIIIAVVGSFAGIAAVSYLSMNYSVPLLVPSFGASAVLLYAACHVQWHSPEMWSAATLFLQSQGFLFTSYSN